MKKKIDNVDGYAKNMYMYKFLLSIVHVRDRSNADNIVMYSSFQMYWQICYNTLMLKTKLTKTEKSKTTKQEYMYIKEKNKIFKYDPLDYN